jgi:hypothetical protein
MWNKEQILALPKNQAVRLSFVGIVSFGVGVSGGHLVTKRKYEALIEDEITEIRQSYLEREQDLLTRMADETPDGEVINIPQKPSLAEMVKDYTSHSMVDPEETGEDQQHDSDISESEPDADPEPELTDEVRKTVSIFDGSAIEEFDQEAEEAWREEHEGEPFIISREEFLENDPEYNQVTITNFEEDDVLADEQDRPVDNMVQVVGKDAVFKFGYGSGDNNVVYVRNPELEIDLEVLRSTGGYAATVLGFKHSDRREPRKFRNHDD